ncbi:hypothetical protein PS9374_07047 [Planomonospora sphaerica]|uniref:Uncharacterized protein n=1 Tax=Planomonospora sphaerica TaxID=161355 RepID=A0A171DQL5_9ACTN|nr:hypothetical protein [Planomonospora sphaerica]GAT71356.1 hypothetical protein PS9374_07047 [Planomonospora sphaerica]
MQLYRGRAFIAAFTLAAFAGGASVAIWKVWDRDRVPPTAGAALALFGLWFWMIARTRTFADPARLRELIALTRTLPAKADAPETVLLRTIDRGRRSVAISRTPLSALAEAQAELNLGAPISTAGYELFVVTPYTITCHRGSVTMERDGNGATRIGLPGPLTDRAVLRELMFNAKTGTTYVTDAEITELAHQLRQAHTPR